MAQSKADQKSSAPSATKNGGRAAANGGARKGAAESGAGARGKNGARGTKSSPHAESATRHPQIVIIGTGFAGLGMAIQLRMAKRDNFLLLEKHGEIGGTWRDNVYPGCACDVPSHFYSYSFALNPRWTRLFPPREEIFAYLSRLAKKYQLYERTRFNTEVASAEFDEARAVWVLTTTTGDKIEADIVISGLGQLNRPKTPKIENEEAFQKIRFHSAQWEYEHDLRTKRIGVIGNGPSAAQFIPELVKDGVQTVVFQRSPAHVLPRNDKPYNALMRFMFGYVPGWTRFYRALLYWMLERNFVFFSDRLKAVPFFKRQRIRLLNMSGNLETMIQGQFDEQVKDPKLRKLLLPNYKLGCKRVVISDDYYPALQAENCTLVTDPIRRFTADGIQTADGTEHKLDGVIYGTGFASTSFLAPMEVRGLGGAELNQVWADGAEAYLGISVPQFPNFFMLYGPNTNLGHNSILFMLECQFRYILSALKRLEQNKARYMNLKEKTMGEFSADLTKRLGKTVWAADCDSWYKNEAGKITNNWPDFTFFYRSATAECSAKDYQFFPLPNR